MNNYADLSPIGQGQYGTAYKARNRLDGQWYCIKRIPMSAKDDQKGALGEVQLLSSIDHPNIIGYKESFIDKDGSLCIVTSFCEEGDLFNRIRKRAAAKQYFSETEVMDMFVQIASALLYIHGKRILHRDLKTQNIFIARGGIIKLGDFGISKVLEKTDQFATTVTGTPYYMAPEICTNQPYTFKSDIWSLGCVLYEMCTLKHAFAADSLLSLVYQIVKGNFPPISSDQFSDGLSNLVNTLLVRDPNTRPSLQSIFQMPYVHDNVQRYHLEERRRVLRTTSTMTRRRQLLEKTVQDVNAGGSTMGGTGGMGATAEEDLEGLTPKERLARKKDAERQRREMELQLASMNMQKDRANAAARKTQMVYASNVPMLSGGGGGGAAEESKPSPPVLSKMSSLTRGGANNPWNVMDDGPGRAPAASGMGGTMGNLDDSMVNLGTMPATAGGFPGAGGYGGTMPSASTSQRMAALRQAPPPSRGGGGDFGQATMSAYDAYENRPIRAAGNTMRPGGPGDDTVLLGTMPGGNGAGFGATANGFGATSGMGYTNKYGDTMVNMGTMNLGGGNTMGAGSTVTYERMGSMRSAASNPWALDSGPMPAGPSSSQKTPQPSSSPPAVPSNVVGGFKFGLTNPGAMPVLPVFPSSRPSSPSPVRSVSPTPDKVRFGVSSDSQPRGSFDYVVKEANAKKSGDDTDYSEYEDDFEDYNPADDQETINQKVKILSNMEDLERSTGFDDDSGIAQVKEKVNTMTKNSKAAAVREKCQQQLGIHFNEVYAYLRRTRTVADPSAIDEREVQKKLLELVGGDRQLLQGCFMVDQLVFQEMMMSYR